MDERSPEAQDVLSKIFRDPKVQEAPLGFREVSESEYCLGIPDQVPTHITFRGFPWRGPTGKDEWLQVSLVLYSGGTGSATWIDRGARKIRFFLLGCKHSNTSEPLGRCTHKLTCTKCGYTNIVDSSD